MANDDYLTVTALTRYLKRKFEVDPYLGTVYLTGEISNYRPRPNAHQYFSLKDDHAKISAIMFKSAFSKVKFQPEEGMKVLVVGRISLYEASGSYQIYVERMEPDGVGQLYQAYEQLKNKLAAEGLFSLPKKPLPRYPKRIAVITSPSGAVIRDIITTTRRRYPIAQLVLFPAKVQGNDAATDIVRQIRRVNQMGNFDTLIVGRGGGSIEDLWPFNEEIVAREIVASQIPVISSVGHETDTTIADLVADQRAATPTAAAELAVPVLQDVVIQLIQARTRLINGMQSLIKIDQTRLNRQTSATVFKQPGRLYEAYNQKLDSLQASLRSNVTAVYTANQRQLSDLSRRLVQESPRTMLQVSEERLANDHTRLVGAATRYFEHQQQVVKQAVSGLDYLSPLKIMSRGYSYVTKQDAVVKSTAQLTAGDQVTLHLAEGSANATIDQVQSKKEKTNE